jgi:hypothetical protein
MGVVGRDKVLQNLAATGCGHALGTEHVLHRDRQARQPAERFTLLPSSIDRSCALENRIYVDVEKGFDFWFAFPDRSKECARNLFG